MEYIADIKISPKSSKSYELRVQIDKSIENTTYDEVTDAIYNEMDKEYPIEDFPKSDIYRIWVIDNGKKYPCLSESEDVALKKLEKSKKYAKILVLPEERYSLTDECRLYMELQKNKIISECEEFDFNKYHTILENIKKGND